MNIIIEVLRFVCDMSKDVYQGNNRYDSSLLGEALAAFWEGKSKKHMRRKAKKANALLGELSGTELSELLKQVETEFNIPPESSLGLTSLDFVKHGLHTLYDSTL